jgi:TolA-binding protein
VRRYGGRGLDGNRRTWRYAGPLLLALLAFVSMAAPGVAAPNPRAEAKPKKTATPDLEPVLDALHEGQRSLAASLDQLREQLGDLQRAVSDLRDEVRQNRDVAQSVLEQVKGMREEVRGLYVESSGLKGDVAQAGKQVEGVNESLGSFRFSSGIVVAVIIVLQFVLIGLMFRGRG